MSLDATILHVERDGADLVLTLGPRIDWDEKQSIAGQPTMRIVRASWDLEPGMDIWGGGAIAQIRFRAMTASSRNYRREGYTRLLEDF